MKRAMGNNAKIWSVKKSADLMARNIFAKVLLSRCFTATSSKRKSHLLSTLPRQEGLRRSSRKRRKTGSQNADIFV